MGREIEMKIPLSNDEFDFIYGLLCGKNKIQKISEIASFSQEHALQDESVQNEKLQTESFERKVFEKKFFLKKDEYFSRYKTESERRKNNEPRVIRIRTEEKDISNEKSAEKFLGTANFCENQTEKKSEKKDFSIESQKNIISQSFFTIKYKTLEDGIEVNREDETFIEDPQVLRDFMKLAGYSCWFKKEKKVCGCYFRFSDFCEVIFHLELEIVNDMKYVEIEVTDKNGSAKDIKNALNEFVMALNLEPQKRDSRSWVEIILGNNSIF